MDKYLFCQITSELQNRPILRDKYRMKEQHELFVSHSEENLCVVRDYIKFVPMADVSIQHA